MSKKENPCPNMASIIARGKENGGTYSESCSQCDMFFKCKTTKEGFKVEKGKDTCTYGKKPSLVVPLN